MLIPGGVQGAHIAAEHAGGRHVGEPRRMLKIEVEWR